MTAAKKYQDHGGVMSLDWALYHAVHDYKKGQVSGREQKGLQRVCDDLGWENNRTISNKFLATYSSHWPTTKEFMAVLGLTRDTRILTAIGHAAGVVWHRLDEMPDAPADLDVLACGASVIGKANAVIQELTDALMNDGEVDAVEKARIQQSAYEAHQSLGQLLAVAAEFEQEVEEAEPEY